MTCALARAPRAHSNPALRAHPFPPLGGPGGPPPLLRPAVLVVPVLVIGPPLPLLLSAGNAGGKRNAQGRGAEATASATRDRGFPLAQGLDRPRAGSVRARTPFPADFFPLPPPDLRRAASGSSESLSASSSLSLSPPFFPFPFPPDWRSGRVEGASGGGFGTDDLGEAK